MFNAAETDFIPAFIIARARILADLINILEPPNPMISDFFIARLREMFSQEARLTSAGQIYLNSSWHSAPS